MRSKKCLLLAFCLVSMVTAKSQSPADLPKIVPPSPELASLAKIGTLSAGLHTGAANVNIPLYEISNGGIKLPIALTYSTNGVRVNEIASRVGLGWNLIAGGVISRTIHDEDDLDPVINQLAPPASFSPTPGNNALYNYLSTANLDGVDTEKDEYSFSVNGMSGRFFMDASGIPRLMNHSNIKLEKSDNVFIVTDPQGVKYYFGGTGFEEKTRGYSTHGNDRWNRLSQTGWFLKRIETPENNWIEFDYADIFTKTWQGSSQSMILVPIQGGGEGQTECSISNPCTGLYRYPVLNEVYYDTKYLTTIRSSNGTIAYFFHQTRGDLGGDNRIVDIKVQQTAINPTSFVKDYHLEYDDFSIPNDMNQRFYLKKFYTNSTTTTGTPPVPDATLVHEFEYNDQGLPSQKSYSQDYFGYFNNKANIDFAPRLANHTNYYASNLGADRSPDFVHMKKGALKKVTYPTGGYEEFDYEQHTLPELFSDSAYSTGGTSGAGKLTNPTSPNLFTLNFSTNSIGVVKVQLSAAQNPAGPFPGQQWHWYPEDAHHLVEFRIRRASDNSVVHITSLNIYQQVNYNIVLPANTAYIGELSVFAQSTLGTVSLQYSPVVTTYWINAPACGMRTKSIAAFDPVTNKTNMKYYKYCNMDDLNKSSGVGAKSTVTVDYYPGGGLCQQYGVLNLSQFLCTSQIQVSSSSLTGMVTFGGSPIAYTNVIEADDLQYVNGGIEHTFHTEYQNSTALPLLGSLIPGATFNVMADMNGIETKTKYFKKVNNNFVVLKRIQQEYSVDSRVYYGVKSYVNRQKWTPISGLPLDDLVKPFDVAEYYFSSTWFHLDNSIVVEYDPSGANPMTSTTTYTYGNTDHTSPTLITATDSKGQPVVQENKYPADYAIAPYTTMVAKHIITPVIENKTIKNNALISTVKIDYKDWFNNGTVLKPWAVNMQKANNINEARLRYHAMDASGNVTEVSKENGTKVSYVWDYIKAMPVAEVKNAAVADIAYCGFETDNGTGNWTILGTLLPVGSTDLNAYFTYYANDGITGKRSFGGRVSRAISSGTTYTVTLWSKATAAAPTANTATGTLIHTKGNWKLYKWNISGTTTVTIQGDQIDDVRLHPSAAQMTSYAYNPLVGLNAVTDAANNIQYYEYDGLNRLLLVRDIDKNILKQYDYKYNQPITPCTTTPQWIPTGITQCVTDVNNIFTGVKQAQERDENNCSNTYLQLRWVIIPTPPGDCVPQAGCGAPNLRLINGVCVPGNKVLLFSHYKNGVYTCTFKYVWSDGYESPSFIEVGSTPCLGIE